MRERVCVCSLLQQLIVAAGPGAEEDMTGLLELLHTTRHTHTHLRQPGGNTNIKKIPTKRHVNYFSPVLLLNILCESGIQGRNFH